MKQGEPVLCKNDEWTMVKGSVDSGWLIMRTVDGGPRKCLITYVEDNEEKNNTPNDDLALQSTDHMMQISNREKINIYIKPISCEIMCFYKKDSM